MNELELVLAIAQGLTVTLLSVLGWVLRRALDEARATERALADVRERLVRVESQAEGIGRLEDKLDALADGLGRLRQEVAAWSGPR